MVYILGGAQTDFERNWTKEGKGMVAILKEVIADGLENAGLDFDDIKSLNRENRTACFVGNFIAEKYVDQGHLGAFLTEVDESFYGVPSARYEAACASGSVAIDAAQSKIKSGDYDVCIVLGWEMMKTVDSKLGGDYLGRAAYYEKECKGIELPFPKLFGKLADETLRKYPDLDETRYMNALAAISTINYENAKRNPLAQTRKWFMSYEQASTRGTETNPFVGGRLAVSDCSQVTDGAAVVILASERFVNERKNKGKPVSPVSSVSPLIPVIKGYGHRNAPVLFDKKIMESNAFEYLLPWTRQAVLDAYKRSGLTVSDIDVFETHDCFTSSEYIAISAFGLTEPGHEYEAVESGLISFKGQKPINPSGGLIGCGHPVGASGVRMLLDLYKQITGTAGNYQVIKSDVKNGIKNGTGTGVRNGMMLNIGGSATTNYVFIVGKVE